MADLSQMSDDDLIKVAGMASVPSSPSLLSGLSDEQLMSAAGIKSLGNDKGRTQSTVQGFNSAVPFGNRITAGLGSGGAYLTSQFGDNSPSISDLYNQARDDQKVTETSHPGYNLAGNIAGLAATLPVGLSRAVATTPILGSAANALSKTAGTAADFIGGASSLGGRALRSTAVATPAGALYGYGASNNDLDTAAAAKDALSSAGVGAALGGALPIAGAALGGIKNEISSLVPSNPQTSAELRAAASPLYERFTQSGGSYSPKLTNEIADLADAARSTGVAGITKPADESLNKALDFYSQLRGKQLSPADVQKLDQSLAEDTSRFNRAGEYNFGRVMNDVKYGLRNRAFDPSNAANYIASGNPAAVNDLVQANQLWSQSYKAADIEKILQKSQGAENPQTSIRTGIKSLLANDKKMVNYSDADKEILQDAMNRGVTGGLIKLLGGRLTDSVAGGIAGMSAGGPVGAVAGSLAGKAVGGIAADAAGGIQANRLRGALKNIQGSSLSPQSLKMLTPQQAMQLTPAQAIQLGIKL